MEFELCYEYEKDYARLKKAALESSQVACTISSASGESVRCLVYTNNVTMLDTFRKQTK